MIRPVLPTVNSRVVVLGIMSKVIAVEPQSDYVWHIELESVGAFAERWSINLPTDFHTLTGRPVSGAGSNVVDGLPSLHCAWNDHSTCAERRYSACGCACHTFAGLNVNGAIITANLS